VIPGIFSFVPEKLAFYEANGAILLDQPDRAMEAADSALSLYDMAETTEPALVQFEKASALVSSGDVAEASRVACEALRNPQTYQSVSVRRRMSRFDQLLRETKTRDADDWWDFRQDLDNRNIPTT